VQVGCGVFQLGRRLFGWCRSCKHWPYCVDEGSIPLWQGVRECRWAGFAQNRLLIHPGQAKASRTKTHQSAKYGLARSPLLLAGSGILLTYSYPTPWAKCGPIFPLCLRLCRAVTTSHSLGTEIVSDLHVVGPPLYSWSSTAPAAADVTQPSEGKGKEARGFWSRTETGGKLMQGLAHDRKTHHTGKCNNISLIAIDGIGES